MRILLTNDDGIHAPGLAVLEKIANQLSDDVWVCAPERDQSGVAHAMSINSPLRLRKIDEKRFALDGTPTDCVIMAVTHIMPEPPELVLSGVNSGQNIGDFATYSGTVAAAMEASFMGIRSIALSQAYNFESGAKNIPWQTCEMHAVSVIQKLISLEVPDRTFFNVNFPNCEPEEVKSSSITKQGSYIHSLHMQERNDSRGLPYHWISFGKEQKQPAASTDIKALSEDQISITPMKVDMTDHEFAKKLNDQF